MTSIFATFLCALQGKVLRKSVRVCLLQSFVEELYANSYTYISVIQKDVRYCEDKVKGQTFQKTPYLSASVVACLFDCIESPKGFTVLPHHISLMCTLTTTACHLCIFCWF